MFPERVGLPKSRELIREGVIVKWRLPETNLQLNCPVRIRPVFETCQQARIRFSISAYVGKNSVQPPLFCCDFARHSLLQIHVLLFRSSVLQLAVTVPQISQGYGCSI